MKPEDLMISDWVSLFQGKPDGSSCNVQVTFVGEYGEVGIEGCEEYTSANCNLLFPIPLTVEILEKNGFKCEEIIQRHWISEDGRILLKDDELLINSSNKWSVHVDNEDMQSIGYFEITHVHELQHALRLCKINPQTMIRTVIM